MPSESELIQKTLIKANATPDGVTLTFGNYADAHKLRFTIYNFLRPIKRTLEGGGRDMLLQTYPEEFLAAVQDVTIIISPKGSKPVKLQLRPRGANPVLGKLEELLAGSEQPPEVNRADQVAAIVERVASGKTLASRYLDKKGG